MNPAIFKNYDIRGVVPEDLSFLDAETIGRAFGVYVKAKYGSRIVIGHDNRQTSPELKDKFVFGLMASGCDVVDVGLSLTPIIQFLTHDRRFDAGVVVTASHNPSKYNGFRFCGRKAEPIFGEQIQEIKELALGGGFVTEHGTVTYNDLNPLYIEYLSTLFNFKKPLKVLIDCGNGTSSAFASTLFSKLGINFEALYCNLDGDYPHGVPDPENNIFMKTLAENVVAGGFDVGFAFDTDSDRFGVVDEKGNIYSNDKMLLFLAEDALKTQKGKVLFDVKSTEVLAKRIKDLGGEPVMIRTGHPYFLKGLKEGALLGAEYSGHLFYGGGYFGYDDGIFASLKVLEVLSGLSCSLSEFMSLYPKTYHTDEIKVPVNDADKAMKLEAVKTLVSSNSKVFKKSEVDGVRVYLNETDWVVIRSSNTTPIFSVRMEAQTKEGLQALAEFSMSLLPELKPEMLVPIHFS